jgi:hypothetical protein
LFFQLEFRLENFGFYSISPASVSRIKYTHRFFAWRGEK